MLNNLLSSFPVMHDDCEDEDDHGEDWSFPDNRDDCEDKDDHGEDNHDDCEDGENPGGDNDEEQENPTGNNSSSMSVEPIVDEGVTDTMTEVMAAKIIALEETVSIQRAEIHSLRHQVAARQHVLDMMRNSWRNLHTQVQGYHRDFEMFQRAMP